MITRKNRWFVWISTWW